MSQPKLSKVAEIPYLVLAHAIATSDKGAKAGQATLQQGCAGMDVGAVVLDEPRHAFEL